MPNQFSTQYGMLGDVFSPRFRDLEQEQRDEEQKLQFLAKSDPFTANAYTAYDGARTAGRALGGLVAGALGKDASTSAERNQAAISAAKEQVSKLGFNPDDPKSIDDFYKNTILILQRQGLVPEAMAVAKEYREAKLAQAHADYYDRGNKPKDLKGRDLLMSKLDDINEKLVSDPDNPQLQQAKANLEKVLGVKTEKPTSPWITHQPSQFSPGYQENKETGEVRPLPKEITRINEPKPLSAKDQAKATQAEAELVSSYDAAKSKAQVDYNNAVELYNHPGLKDAVGVVAGLASKGDVNNPGFGNTVNRAWMGKAGRSALAKMQEVSAGVFIAALKDLQATGNKGSTGLGQLTEIEGAKIQSAKAALDPQQDYGSYRANLKQYIDQLESSSQLIDEKASRSGIKTIRPLQTKPLGAPVPAGRSVPAPAPVDLKTSPAAAAAGAAEEWERDENGKIKPKGK